MTSEGSPEVLFDVEDGIATITLNRPEKMNAVTTAMNNRILELLDVVDAEDRIRVLVITGAGRAFCAGADLGAGASAFDFANRSDTPKDGRRRDKAGEVTLRLFRLTKPVIAAVNGAAVGYGASLMLPADFRIIAESAKIGFVFGARGIAPDGASSWFLPKIVGIPRALDWFLTGRIFSGAEALEAGLARNILPAGDVLAAARVLGAEIAATVAPVSAAIMRQLVWQSAGDTHPMHAHRIESRAIVDTGVGADAAEGVASFLQKRRPEWSMSVSKQMPEWFPWIQEPPFRGDVK